LPLLAPEKLYIGKKMRPANKFTEMFQYTFSKSFWDTQLSFLWRAMKNWVMRRKEDNPGSIRKCNTWSCWSLAGTLGGYGKKI